jgi:hypothetical protein
VASPLTRSLDSVKRLEDGGAGADVVQQVSAVLHHGPAYFIVMRERLTQWTASKQIATLADGRGRLSVAHGTDPAFFERRRCLRTLQSEPLVSGKA